MRDRRTGLKWMVLAACGAATLAAPLSGQISYNGYIEAASGNYIFADRATTLSLSNGLQLQKGRFYGAASFPLVLQNSSALSYIAGRPVPTGGPENGKVRESRGGGHGGQGGRSTQVPIGFAVVADSADIVDVTPPGDFEFHIGDPRFTAGVELLQGTGLLRSISLEAYTKAPLADLESGVGTGEWDYGLGTAVMLGTGSTFLFADVAWWKLGDLPELDLEDPFQFGLSIGRSLGLGRWSVLASWTGSTRMIDGVDPEHALSLACYLILGPGRSLNAGLSTGLTESGSDFAAFIGWSFTLRE